jgi:hypothetical protein
MSGREILTSLKIIFNSETLQVHTQLIFFVEHAS